MKTIKRLVGLLLVIGSIACTGCGNGASQALTPVEDSGEQITAEGMTVNLPKGWTEVEDGVSQGGFLLKKGTSSLTVIKMEQEGLSQLSIDDLKATFETSFGVSGSTVAKSEKRTYTNVGEGVFFALENVITQELIDNNIKSGIYNEDELKNTDKLIGKTSYESAVCFTSGDAMIIIDGVTYMDDAAGIEEVVTFIANSMTIA